MIRTTILLSLLSIILCADACATTETHIWAFGQWPHRYGLVGVRESSGEVYTFIEYGSGPYFVSLPLHIYWVTAIASMPIFSIVGFWFVRRHRRRDADAA